ncbi:MAG: type II toxin-antitoxin system ParD family antitoxin [Pirellulales bacterium]
MSFTPELDRLVQERLAQGDYPTADALLIDALLALRELEAKRAELQAAVSDRRERAGKGVSLPLDLDSFLQTARDRRDAPRS